MIGDKDKFLSLEKQKGKVTFGDNASGSILGKGTVKIGKNKAKNVLLVENLKPILLMLARLVIKDTFVSLILRNVKLSEEKQGNWLALP